MATTKKAASKKTVAKKTVAKKVAPKKPVAKKVAPKKTPVKKVTPKKPAAPPAAAAANWMDSEKPVAADPNSGRGDKAVSG